MILRSILSLVSLITLMTCQNQSASILETKSLSGISESVLYISSRGNGFDIYKNDTKGEQEIKITRDPGWEWHPQPIPTKQLIVYNSQDTTGRFQLKAMDHAGAPMAFDGLGLPEFIIAPTGDWIAYTRKSGEATHILIAPYGSIGDSLQITTGDSYHGRPLWSNDGKRLVFISDQTGSNEIYIYDRITGRTSQVTENKLREKYISWSPDDGRIAATMNTDSTLNDIYLIELASRETTPLVTTPLIDEGEIAWSPSGKYIAYHAEINEKMDIYLIEIASQTVTKITNGEGYHGEPAWVKE